jgi:hypothetical protein
VNVLRAHVPADCSILSRPGKGLLLKGLLLNGLLDTEPRGLGRHLCIFFCIKFECAKYRQLAATVCSNSSQTFSSADAKARFSSSKVGSLIARLSIKLFNVHATSLILLPWSLKRRSCRGICTFSDR